ncbi:OmpH family outer membrane protein [Rickettsiella massiliensis]|uniref:OmpH family outer membrane protein n=1 Tax=Rickettsiella massiliensis TaxID=676517 RepID=UPI00029A198F|nr:OmpH family outer membrane protein [Rickettsiella massiliensis]
MKKLWWLSVTAMLLTVFTLGAQAEGLKLAIVDMQAILQKAPQIAKINDALTRQFKGRQDKIVQSQKELQSEKECYA